MARPCQCCSSPRHERIDVELAGGETLASVARHNQVSVDSLKRHKARHLSPALTAVALEHVREQSARGAYDQTVDRLESLIDRLEDLLAVAEDRKSLVGGANIAREIRSALELVARLRGELDMRPVNVAFNVMASEEFAEVLSTIIGTLEPWPEARVAIADKLNAIDVQGVRA